MNQLATRSYIRESNVIYNIWLLRIYSFEMSATRWLDRSEIG